MSFKDVSEDEAESAERESPCDAAGREYPLLQKQNDVSATKISERDEVLQQET